MLLYIVDFIRLRYIFIFFVLAQTLWKQIKMMPIFVDLKDKKVVIFGGGELGGWKAKKFLEGGCEKILIVSKNFSEEIKSLRDNVEVIQKDLTKGFGDLLKGAFIVVPATNDEELNDAIREESVKRGILTNHRAGDLFLSSVVRDGNIEIAISTGGHSPAVSKYLKVKLEKFLGNKFDEMAELQEKIRKILMDEIENRDERKEILWEILNDDKIWESANLEEALKIARKHVRKRYGDRPFDTIT